MSNVIATFDNILDLKKLVKKLKKNSKLKGRILLVNKSNEESVEEAYISSVLIKRSREISKLKLDDTKLGILLGALIGGFSSFFAIILNRQLLHISTLNIIAMLAIIFYGAAVGSIMGLLINNLVRKYDETNFKGEITLIIKDIEDEFKDNIIEMIKQYNPSRLNIY